MKTEGTQPSLELVDFMEMNAFESLKVPWLLRLGRWQNSLTDKDFVWAN